MDTIRYAAALVVWTAVPPALLYWYLIHPLAGYWQTVGRTRALLVVLPLCLLLLGIMLRWSGPVAGSDLGRNYAAFYSGLILFTGAVLADRRIRRDLGSRSLAGSTELLPGARPAPPAAEAGDADADTSREVRPPVVTVLVTDGVYGLVRHPRYAAVTVGTLGLALVAHHAAAYAIVLVMVPLILVLARLEEAQLLERFGDEYRRYREAVSAFIPPLSPPERS